MKVGQAPQGRVSSSAVEDPKTRTLKLKVGKTALDDALDDIWADNLVVIGPVAKTGGGGGGGASKKDARLLQQLAPSRTVGAAWLTCGLWSLTCTPQST